MPKPPALLPALLLAALVALAGCDTAEERAEKHYEAGMALLAEGDVDRALVEFRNVFQLNGRHREARLTYARVQRERGETTEAYGQYLRLVEQYPDTVEARRALAEMAVARGDWAEAERHGRAGRALDGEDPALLAVNAALDYRAATVAKLSSAAAEAAAAARAALERDPENAIARRVVIDHLVTGPDPQAALPEIEAALEQTPEAQDLHFLRLRLLAGRGDAAATGAALTRMAELFPGEAQVRNLLVGWHLEQGDAAGAEAFLRARAAEAGADPEPHLELVRFLRQTAGAEAARAELDRLAGLGGAEADLYRATRATLDFESGDAAGAIAGMQAILADAAPSDRTRDIKAALARMLAAQGENTAAQARIDEVLAEDPGHVEALKMRALRLIEDDRPGEAILVLRTALDQNPRDPGILTLMGQAHERDGARELAGERYGLAVEVSGRAAPESLRYAAFLAATGRVDTAGTVLADALRVSPQEVRLMVALADIRMRQGDWPRTEEMLARLRALGGAEAQAAANGIEAGLMLRQEKVEETVGFLQGLIDGGDAGTAAVAAIVQTRVRDGQTGAARDYLEARLAETPQDPALRMLRAGLHVLEGETEAAERLYLGLIGEAPEAEAPVQALYGLYALEGRDAEAAALLDRALAARPGSRALRLIRAGRLEQAQDFEGAIALYEALYAEDSGDPVVANNLASLITTHRAGAADLERAHAIARRLRGVPVPAFQDTYGWIEHLRGNSEEALRHLEPAAQGLPQDPMVQAHLGLAYAAAGQAEKARAALVRALEIAGESPLPQFAEARAALEALPAAD